MFLDFANWHALEEGVVEAGEIQKTTVKSSIAAAGPSVQPSLLACRERNSRLRICTTVHKWNLNSARSTDVTLATLSAYNLPTPANALYPWPPIDRRAVSMSATLVVVAYDLSPLRMACISPRRDVSPSARRLEYAANEFCYIACHQSITTSTKEADERDHGLLR